MKKTLITLLITICAIPTIAQTKDNGIDKFQAVFDACLSLREAAASNDSAAIRRSARDLKACQIDNFSTLHSQDGITSSLNGHLVFDEAFADSLAEGKPAYEQSDSFQRSRDVRGQFNDGSIHTKTCFVKAGQSTKWSFASSGHQELAVVAEAGGLVTMKIHVTNSAGFDKRFDDTKNVKKGMPQRRTSFDLPDRRNTVELEVINCGKKDCSFVVISN